MGNEGSALRDETITLSGVDRDASGDIDTQNLFPEWNNRVAKEMSFITQLGKGGFGKVWSCRRIAEPNGDILACKIVDKSKMKADTLSSLHDEIEFAQKLKHKGLVKFFGGYETRKKLYILFETCSGGELLARICKLKNVPSDKVIHIIRQMLEVIEYCHNLGVIHCDLKPENVLFVEKGGWDIKVIDFGLSKVRRKHEWLSKLGGTPYYIAPECIKKRYSDAIDIYAIGIMTFELLHGYLPFEGTPGDPISPIKQAMGGLQNVTKPGKGPWFNSKFKIPDLAKDFILNLSHLDPAKRMTASEALQHPFLNSGSFNIHSFVLKNLQKKSCMTTLQRFVKDTMHDPSHSLNPWFLKSLKEEFHKYAENGELSFENFSIIMNSISQDAAHVDEYELHEMFDNMDIDKSKTIDVEEFLKFCAYEHIARQDDRLWEVIKMMDKNGDGFVDLEEITALVKENPQVVKHVGQEPMDQIKAVLKKGPLKIEDFIAMLDQPPGAELSNGVVKLGN